MLGGGVHDERVEPAARFEQADGQADRGGAAGGGHPEGRDDVGAGPRRAPRSGGEPPVDAVLQDADIVTACWHWARRLGEAPPATSVPSPMAGPGPAAGERQHAVGEVGVGQRAVGDADLALDEAPGVVVGDVDGMGEHELGRSSPNASSAEVSVVPNRSRA